jgi:hypothetical protein
LEGLRFVDPSKDWLTHMQQLMPIENPKGVAGLAKQKFAGSYREFDSDPTDPECPHRQRSTYCHLMHHADGSGLLVPPHTSVLTCRLLKRKPSLQCAWLLPRLSAIPTEARRRIHTAQMPTVWNWSRQ